MAMIGDAISHAVLPGIVIAYFITHNRTGFPVLAGAAASGILVTWFIQFFNKRVRLQMDASIGISYTFLFAVGIILISLFGSQVDLDQECVLYGEIAYAPLDTWISPGGINLGPRAVYILAAMLLLNLSFVLLSYKELSITTFDPDFASTIGLNTTLWHYLLMGATSFTTVATFEVVGAILVVALLVAPPATAYLCASQRLHTMLLTAILMGVLTAVGGYYLAIWINGSIAGAMATTCGGFFLFIFLVQQLKIRSTMS